MMTAIGVIVVDIVLLVLFVCQYRQEIGLSVNGSHDAPVKRKPAPKPASNPPPSSSEPIRQITGRP